MLVAARHIHTQQHIRSIAFLHRQLYSPATYCLHDRSPHNSGNRPESKVIKGNGSVTHRPVVIDGNITCLMRQKPRRMGGPYRKCMCHAGNADGSDAQLFA